MRLRIKLTLFGLFLIAIAVHSEPFDAAPFGASLPERNGLVWDDPREIHQVTVHFAETPPAADKVRLEYWGSRWPQQHLPKDREPGGADVGWMELGNWWNGGWRVADSEATVSGNDLTFTFKPVGAREFPAVKGYPATFRYTLKIRVTSEQALPRIERIVALTDSESGPGKVRLVWREPPQANLQITGFNGLIEK